MVPIRFVGYDEGRQTLGLYGTAETDGWRLSLAELPLARDLQRAGRRALVGFDRGYFEVDVDRGEVVKLVDRWTGVTSARRVGNHTLIAGMDLGGLSGITVLTLDGDDRVIKTASRPGSYVRLLRPTPQGTWLLGADDRFLETDTDLVGIGALTAPGFRHAWLARRGADGSTLVSAGYGAFLARFDALGRLERTFGGADEVPPEVEPFFYASFEPAPGGGVLVANWQGHGEYNGSKGRQLVHFDANGDYVDSCSWPGISSLQGILILD